MKTWSWAGAEWHGMDTGMVTLKPGESTQWHVRLELLTLPPSERGISQVCPL